MPERSTSLYKFGIDMDVKTLGESIPPLSIDQITLAIAITQPEQSCPVCVYRKFTELKARGKKQKTIMSEVSGRFENPSGYPGPWKLNLWEEHEGGLLQVQLSR